MIRVSEFVGRGHPDKMADRLADRLAHIVVHAYPKALNSCGLEVLLTNDHVTVAGEVGNLDKLEEWQITRLRGKLRREVKLFLIEHKYDPVTFSITLKLNSQSNEIRNYSYKDIFKLKSGDQSIVYGYAQRSKLGLQTYMPEDFDIARKIVERLGSIWCIHDDCKCLVEVDDDYAGGSVKVRKILVSAQHRFDVDINKVRALVIKEAILPTVRELGLEVYDDALVMVNPGGEFITGGLGADTGVTNRKLLATSYGTSVQHGGGGLYGKDLSKVDRLGAYWARFICKNMVASGLCERLELGVCFFPGIETASFIIKDFTFKRNKFDKPLNREILLSVIATVFGKYSYSEIFSLFAPWAAKGIQHYVEDCHFGHPAPDLDINWESVCFEKEIWEALDKALKEK